MRPDEPPPSSKSAPPSKKRHTNMTDAPDWKSRLTDERSQLADCLTKLTAYLDNPDTAMNTAEKELGLLVTQRALMQSYLDVLDQRLALIPPAA
jgi:crAss001_48 related protein